MIVIHWILVNFLIDTPERRTRMEARRMAEKIKLYLKNQKLKMKHLYFLITLTLNFIADVIIIAFTFWTVYKIYKLKLGGYRKEMTEIDEIINKSIDLKIEDLPKTEGLPKTDRSEELRERLIGIAVAGKSKEYLGNPITSEEIERLDHEAILKLYARYETCMGGLVTKSLKEAFLAHIQTY